eukprot:NODE_5252_length_520_cov_239.218684_g3888_i0.p1 GENE.NODE_5252_length_520_cov_239.218684_g3888_i0~~NODE_5252_length_520_cov_239.218684_g3888_i0.p1  ORF type:complete len:116 (+),score=38.95 NODE_5252_length_520_cov_239.218684_g3888_i0:35-349(+)
MGRCTSMKLLVWTVVAVGYLAIIATHFHYTIDVVVGFWLTFLFWKMYHSYVPTLHLRDSVLARILQWAERDAPDLAHHQLCVGADLSSSSSRSVPASPFSGPST